MTDGLALDFFPIRLSLLVASLATVCAAVLGLPIAWLLARRRFPGRSLLEVLVLLPMVLPPTVIGYYLLLTVGREGAMGASSNPSFGAPLVFTPVAAVLATGVAAAPFLVRAAQGGIEQVDTIYEDAARTLGRSELSVFFTVTLPLAWRGILAGTTLCFARAMGEFGATLMLAGNIPGRTQTASLAVYDAVQPDQHAEALAALARAHRRDGGGAAAAHARGTRLAAG